MQAAVPTQPRWEKRVYGVLGLGFSVLGFRVTVRSVIGVSVDVASLTAVTGSNGTARQAQNQNGFRV